VVVGVPLWGVDVVGEVVLEVPVPVDVALVPEDVAPVPEDVALDPMDPEDVAVRVTGGRLVGIEWGEAVELGGGTDAHTTACKALRAVKSAAALSLQS